MKLITKKHTLVQFVLALGLPLFAQTNVTDSTAVLKTNAKVEESNRNVMLNASDDNGPRQISIGLPVVNAGDVIILENDLPVVYHYWPHTPSSHWRADSSLERLGLLKLGEVQTTTGRVGYATNSYTKLGTDKFQGKINYRLNHFNMQQFDITVSGPVSNGWLYSASIYQNFDPGTFKVRYSDLQERTSIYKGSITKKWKSGEVTLLYKHSDTRSLANSVNTAAPFIYNGDGSISEINGFKLGTDNYSPIDGKMSYMDIVTGEVKETSLWDASRNKSNEVGLLGKFNLKDGSHLKFSTKYSYSNAAIVLQSGLSITEATETDGYTYMGTETPYEGYVQNRMSMIDFGKVHDAMLMAEWSKPFRNHALRIGMNEWFNTTDYVGNSTRYQHELAVDPQKVDRNGVTYSGYNTSGEFYEGKENRVALYASDNWDVSKKINLSIGARLEYFTLDGKNLPYARYNGFYLGSVNPTTGEVATKEKFSHDWFLPSFTINATYKLTRQFGFLAEASYSQQGGKLSDYAGFSTPYTDAVSVPYGRGGLYFNNDFISLVSAVTYIKKTNFQSRFNLVDPEDSNITNMYHLKYDVETIGWTTDAIVKPFKGAELHLLATVQSPKYKKYDFEAYNTKYDFNDKQVTGISKVMLEIDPSYRPNKDLRIWASFRYFSRQYASTSNVLYFNARWETFAGIDYTVNKHVTLSGQVVNFLNETGASGSISGSELMTDGSIYKGTVMSGRYLRPLTFEAKATFKF